MGFLQQDISITQDLFTLSPSSPPIYLLVPTSLLVPSLSSLRPYTVYIHFFIIYMAALPLRRSAAPLTHAWHPYWQQEWLSPLKAMAGNGTGLNWKFCVDWVGQDWTSARDCWILHLRELLIGKAPPKKKQGRRGYLFQWVRPETAGWPN